MGRISVAGDSGRVTYRWIRSDGASTPVQTLIFDGPGSQDVNTSWFLGAPPGSQISVWQAIQIIEPQGMNSNRAEFNLLCE
jgi:hypothetical protein